jgi:hypothetical protein
MGWNSTLIVLNDALSFIEKDFKFGKSVSDAIAEQHMTLGKRVDISAGNFGNAASVISQQHADLTQIVAVGGNHGSLLGMVLGGGRHHEQETQLKILKDLAGQLGYDLRKKPSRGQK